jgi:hypothetical protein
MIMSQRDEERARAKFADKMRQKSAQKKQLQKKVAPKEDSSQTAARNVKQATERT